MKIYYLRCINAITCSSSALIFMLLFIMIQICSQCGTEDHVATMVTSFASRLEKCHACSLVLCSKCWKKTPLLLPEGGYTLSLLLCVSLSHTHIHTRTHNRTHTHTYTHTHTHTHSFSSTAISRGELREHLMDLSLK